MHSQINRTITPNATNVKLKIHILPMTSIIRNITRFIYCKLQHGNEHLHSKYLNFCTTIVASSLMNLNATDINENNQDTFTIQFWLLRFFCVCAKLHNSTLLCPRKSIPTILNEKLRNPHIHTHKSKQANTNKHSHTAQQHEKQTKKYKNVESKNCRAFHK